MHNKESNLTVYQYLTHLSTVIRQTQAITCALNQPTKDDNAEVSMTSITIQLPRNLTQILH